MLLQNAPSSFLLSPSPFPFFSPSFPRKRESRKSLSEFHGFSYFSKRIALGERLNALAGCFQLTLKSWAPVFTGATKHGVSFVGAL